MGSYGFADLEYAMCFNCALSSVYQGPQAGVAHHDGDLDDRWGSLQRQHQGGHQRVEAGVRENNRGQWHHRTGREFRTGRRARKIHGEGDRKTKLRKREGKSTLSLALPIHTALMGAYEILMGFEGEGGAAEVV